MKRSDNRINRQNPKELNVGFSMPTAIFPELLHPEHDDIRLLINEIFKKSGISGGPRYHQAPFAIWPLHRNRGGQAAQPRFFGVPAKVLAQHGIRPDQAEVARKVGDHRWLRARMEGLYANHGYVYGGCYGVTVFAHPDAVDTADVQRLHEWALDEASRTDLEQLKMHLAHHTPLSVKVTKTNVRRIVTGEGEPARAEAWDTLFRHEAMPRWWHFDWDSDADWEKSGCQGSEFFVSLKNLRSLNGSTPDARILEVSPLGVAYAIGQIRALSTLGGSQAFDTEHTTRVLNWLWTLPEGQRRLARHILLSPGDKGSYAYLADPYFAAAILGLVPPSADDSYFRQRAQRLKSRVLECFEGILEASLPAALPVVALRIQEAILRTREDLAAKRNLVPTLKLAAHPPDVPATIQPVTPIVVTPVEPSIVPTPLVTVAARESLFPMESVIEESCGEANFHEPVETLGPVVEPEPDPPETVVAAVEEFEKTEEDLLHPVITDEVLEALESIPAEKDATPIQREVVLRMAILGKLDPTLTPGDILHLVRGLKSATGLKSPKAVLAVKALMDRSHAEIWIQKGRDVRREAPPGVRPKPAPAPIAKARTEGTRHDPNTPEWASIREQLSDLVPPSTFETYIAPLEDFPSESGKILYLRTTSKEDKSWIEEMLTEEISSAAEQAGYAQLRIQFLVAA